MTKTVNIGIIGGGLMGRELAAALQRWPALVDHPVEPRLVAVADLQESALDWFRGIPTVRTLVTDYRELLADEDVDVVYIAVRHDLHEQLYVDTIRAGKDLLAEKPFGIDGPAADRILAALAENPAVFARVSSEFPYFPGAQWAYRYVRSGALGRVIRARNSFRHSSDLDPAKPLNWKRQVRYCGAAGVMNDLGLHTWHLPLRLGWAPERVHAELQNLVPFRPGPDGALEECDTWDNATIHSWARHDGEEFPLTTETRRIDPGQKNTWEFEAIGMDGGVRFSTANPKRVEVFGLVDVPGVGREQSWQSIDAGSQSVWPTVTGAIFETGFSDAILQMWAAYLAEREGVLGDGLGCVTPEEAALTHRIFAAAMSSHAGQSVNVVG